MPCTAALASTLAPVAVPCDGATVSPGMTPTLSPPVKRPTPLVGSWAEVGWDAVSPAAKHDNCAFAAANAAAECPQQEPTPAPQPSAPAVSMTMKHRPYAAAPSARPAPAAQPSQARLGGATALPPGYHPMSSAPLAEPLPPSPPTSSGSTAPPTPPTPPSPVQRSAPRGQEQRAPLRGYAAQQEVPPQFQPQQQQPRGRGQRNAGQQQQQQPSRGSGNGGDSISRFTPPPPPPVALARELLARDSDTAPTDVLPAVLAMATRWACKVDAWVAAHPRSRPSAPCPVPAHYATMDAWLEKVGLWYQANFDGRKVAKRSTRGGAAGGARQRAAPMPLQQPQQPQRPRSQ